MLSIPANDCYISSGLKPTNGLVPTSGVYALLSLPTIVRSSIDGNLSMRRKTLVSNNTQNNYINIGTNIVFQKSIAIGKNTFKHTKHVFWIRCLL